MRPENSRLDRDYEKAKANNDWQGMAAAHALRMRNRTKSDHLEPESETHEFDLIVSIIAGVVLGFVLGFALFGYLG